MCGPHHCLGRDASAPNPAIFCGPLQPRQNSSILEQGCTSGSPGSANRCDQFTRHPWRTSSPLRPCLSFRYTQAVKFAYRQRVPIKVWKRSRARRKPETQTPENEQIKVCDTHIWSRNPLTICDLLIDMSEVA